MPTIDILRQLIAFDTTSAKTNLPLIEFVEKLLAGSGIVSHRIPDPTGNKANLLASIGPQSECGVVLSAHTDVVPVDGQEWSTDPFTLTERRERLYGRGTADMKSFLAAILAALPAITAADLTIPLHIALTYDEEIGGLGVPDLVTALQSLPHLPRFCIVGEPTGMQVVTDHKGIGTYRVSVTGVERHSSLAPLGVNAVEFAARLIVFIQDMARDLAETGPFDNGYVVPHSTVHVGTVAGGTALNIVPGTCTFEFEIRDLPSDDLSAILRRIQTEASRLQLEMGGGGAIHIEPVVYLPGLSTAQNAPVVEWAVDLIGRHDTGKVTYGSEAGLFSNAGIPSIVLGPGDIAQAHQPDEFVAIDQLVLADRLVSNLIAWASR